ncbi:MAG: hypothetical protein ABFE01_05985, partial [Phycisphaerales bacterium]
AAGYESIAEWKKALEDSIVVLRRRANALQNTSDQEVKAAAAAAEIARKRQEFQDKLGAAYAKTDEAQRIALEADIAYWESALKTAGASSEKIIAILKGLREEYAKKFPAIKADSGYYDQKTKQLKKLEDQDEKYYNSILSHEAEVNEADQQRLEDEGERELMRLERMKAYDNEGQRLAAARVRTEELTAEQIDQIRERSWDFASGLLTALGDLQRATLDRELAALTAEQERELEAFEGTEEEKAALIEQHEKEKAKLEYDAALKSWRLQLAGAIVSGARAILSGFQTTPFIPMGLLAGAMATALTAVQIAAIRQAKPVPSFSTGADFTVPAGYPNDSYPMNVESGEHVTVTPAGQGGEPLHIVVNLDGRPILDTVARASRDRRLLIDARSVVP